MAKVIPERKSAMKSYRKELWFEVPTRRAFIGRRKKRALVKIIGE